MAARVCGPVRGRVAVRVRVRVRVRGRRARELGRDLLNAREARADEGALHEQAIHGGSGASDVPLEFQKETREEIQTDKQLFSGARFAPL